MHEDDLIEDELDPHAILSALGVAGVSSVERVSGGTDTTIWRVEADGRNYALRVFRAGDQDDADRERTVMQAARAAGLPTPEVCAAGNWRGRPALLLEWLPGAPVIEELRRRPWRAWRLGASFGAMQARIHAVVAPAALTEQPDEWIAWLGPDKPALAERLCASGYRHDALLHLDYHPLNTLTDGERITAVLDWRNALAGEPRADAARTLGILQVGIPGRLSPLARLALWRFAAGWRAGYQREAGPLRAMTPFHAWAGAVMLRDLAAKASPAHLARIRRWTDRWLAQL